MKEYDYKILEDRFKQLPEDIQSVLSSTDVSEIIKEIGKKNSLLLDQESIMFDMITYVLLGLMPANKFVSTFSDEAKVTIEVATAVAQDVNKEVFGKIKSSMQNVEENYEKEQEKEVSAIEKAGQFTLDPNPTQIRKDETIDVTDADRPKILDGVENPPPVQEESFPKQIQTVSGASVPANQPDVLIDHLLTTPVKSPEQKIEKIEIKPYEKDPYHEII